MNLKSVYAMTLAVALLAVVSPARGDYEAPPVPVGGWIVLHNAVIYPEMAQEAGIEGEVVVYVYIDERGKATDMEVVKGCQETGFVDAACDAIRRTPFEPGQRQSTPVGMWVSIRVVFSLTS